MANKPGSVVLIFRKIESRWRDEHPLNLLAAFATRSQYSHVEISIGDEAGQHGEISNVLRIFNDDIGVEVAQRTGRSPAFHYVQLGCSLASEHAMLRFARQQVGKPFSMRAMMRSIVWPRKTDGSSWFCAELVANTLQKGGLYPLNENPGAATPESLYRRFISQATTTGNPCTMRSIFPSGASASLIANRGQTALQERQEQINPLLKHCNITLGGTLASPGALAWSRPMVQERSMQQAQHQVHYQAQQLPYQFRVPRSGFTQIAMHESPYVHPVQQVQRSNAEEAIRNAVRRANIHQLSSHSYQKVLPLDIR